jgi:hypothetical protein
MTSTVCVIKTKGRTWKLDGATCNAVVRFINIGGAETSNDEVAFCSDADSHVEGIHPLPDSH